MLALCYKISIMDIFSPAKRSSIMQAVSGKNTNPERSVRSILHRMGYRFRLHGKHLPGKPDIYLTKYKTAIFVHGCYWHRHKSCKKGQSTPASNKKFWQDKFDSNVARDRKNLLELRKLGWKTFVLWECELKNTAKIENKIMKNIGNE